MADAISPNELLEALAEADGPLLTVNAFPTVPYTKIKSALDSLKSHEMIQYDPIEREEALLTPEAEGIVKHGSHEAKVFEAVRQAVEGLKIKDLPVRYTVREIGDHNNEKIGDRRWRGSKSGSGQGVEGEMDQKGRRHIQSEREWLQSSKYCAADL